MSNQRTVVVSTCGTSALTNKADAAMRALLRDHANATALSLPADQRQQFEAWIAQRRAELAGAAPAAAAALSAELHGVVRINGGVLPAPRSGKQHHVLLPTDTFLGRAAVSLVEEWLQARGMTTSRMEVPGLRTDDLADFQAALGRLVYDCDESLPRYRAQGWRIVFNLVGGFKAIQGFMQTVGLFYADESVYIFESGDALMRLPRLPIRLDVDGELRAHAQAYRRLARGEVLAVAACAGISETALEVLDGQAWLSPWGRLCWSQGKQALYGEALCAPLSPRLQVSATARRAFDKLETQRKVLVNAKLDELAWHLDERSAETNPKSLSFKPLKGQGQPPATHECYAWSDQDAWRILGHYEDERFVVDDIRKHL